MKRKRVVILFIGIALALATAAQLFPSAQQKPRSKVDEPTPIQEGVMTERQKKHSKLYKGLKDVMGGRKLRDVLAERGDFEVYEEAPDGQVPRVVNLNNYLRNVACPADAVVIGTVQSKASQLIDEGTFTFTDYQVTVQEILKNSSAGLLQNGTLTTTRSGGSVKLNGHVIRAIDRREEPLGVGGQYLLFLRLIPETGGYLPAGNSLNEDTFELAEGNIIQVSEKSLPFKRRGKSANAASFMTELSTVLKNVCSK